MKRIIGVLLTVAFLTGIGINIYADTEQDAETAIYVGSDITTKGNWCDVYGESGYIIFYGSTEETSGRDNTAKHIENLPQYAKVQCTSPGFSYNVVENPTEDERALLMPSDNGFIRRAVKPYNYNKNAWSVKLNDGNKHIVSFYVTAFKDVLNNIDFKIKDMYDEIIGEGRFNYNEGTYLSVCADSDFSIEISSEKVDETVAVNAVFFDELSETGIQRINVTAGEKARSSNIGFDTSASSVNIYRKSNYAYELVAENVTQSPYIDTDLDSGVSYTYMLMEKISPLYTQPVTAQYMTEEYNEVSSEILGENAFICEKPGDKISFAAAFSDKNGVPIEGLDITVKLNGEFGYLTEEEKIILSGKTDTQGRAEFEYCIEYYGNYNLEITSEYDDERKYAKTKEYIGVTLDAGVYKDVPYLSKVSEEISPGEIFNIYGQGITGDVLIAAYPADGEASAVPPAGAYILDASIIDESGFGYYASVIFPEALTPGVYDIWVKNDYGWSLPIRLNEPIGLFMDEFEIYDGLEVRLVGRNFDSSLFGAEGAASIRLKDNNGNTYDAQILESNRVMVKFTVNNVPPGEYFVEVNNSFNDNNFSMLQSDQTLTVMESFSDPLSIGVPWADDFNTTVYNAEDFGIVPNTEEDMSGNIDSAVKAIEKLGGGILQFAEGDYIANYFALASGVILNGAGKERTRLVNTDTRNYRYRFSTKAKKEGNVGVSNLTVYSPTQESVPVQTYFILDGNDSSCENIFFSDVNIIVGEGLKSISNAVGILGLYQRLLIQNCSFDGIPTSGYIRKYGKFLNNEFRYTYTSPALFAEYSTIYNNKTINPQVEAGNIDTTEGIHGYSIKGNTYFAENEIVLGLHPENEGRGEVVMMEPPGTYFACGRIINATSDTLRIEGHEHMVSDGVLELPKPKYGELCVAIAGGMGMGQYRKIIAAEGDDTLIVDKAWDILPDRSSTYTIMVVFENTTIYKNRGEQCEASIAFYSNCIGGTALENVLDTTGGITVNAFHVESTERVAPVYNIRIEDNIITNYIEHDSWKGISATGNRGGDDIQVMGIEIKDNSISNSEGRELYQGQTATRMRVTGSYIGWDYNVIGNIISNNQYVGFETPILLDGANGVVLSDNSFTDCGDVNVTQTASTSNVQDLSGNKGSISGYISADGTVNNGLIINNTPVYKAEKNGDTLNVTVGEYNFINTGISDAEGVFIAAVYSDNRLSEVKSIPVKIAGGKSLKENIILTGVKDTDTVKLMMWNDFNNLVSLCDRIEFIPSFRENE